MKPKVYLETSIISYLTARPSRNVITIANQQLAQEWWDEHRSEVDLYVSQIVIDEAGKGDAQMAQMRLDLLADVPLLENNAAAKNLAGEILKRKILPVKATLDVFHIAIATVHAMDFLLTLNCKHIANAFIYKHIGKICLDLGFDPPVVCTPQEILGKENKIDEG
jgi:hypothetical protein